MMSASGRTLNDLNELKRGQAAIFKQQREIARTLGMPISNDHERLPYHLGIIITDELREAGVL